jgi:hypothetical protein
MNAPIADTHRTSSGRVRAQNITITAATKGDHVMIDKSGSPFI